MMLASSLLRSVKISSGTSLEVSMWYCAVMTLFTLFACLETKAEARAKSYPKLSKWTCFDVESHTHVRVYI